MPASYRADIDGLRAVAILSVVACHAGLPGFSGGYVGVDVFFVISGFLITRVLLRRSGTTRESLLDFYDRRVRRLLPALILVLASTTVMALFVLPPASMVEYAKSMAAAGLFSSNLWFWHVSGYFGPDAMAQPLLHTWSLGVEEQFYLLYPFAIIVLDRPRFRKAMPLAFVAGIVLSFALAQYEVEKPATAAFFLLPTRAWELLAGSLAALNTRPVAVPALRNALGLAGILLIAIPVVSYDGLTPFPGLAAVPPVLGAALLIIIGDRGTSWANRWLGSSMPVGVGRMSYSLYLWHWPLLSLPRIWLGREPEPAQMAALVLLAFGLSIVSWRYVETPARRDDFLGGRRNRFIAAGCAAIAVIAASGALVGLDGIPSRVPPSVLEAEAEAKSPWPLLQTRCRKGILPAAPEWCVSTPAGPSRGTILVWGDSHAEQYYVAIASAMAPRGYTVVLASQGSCPPIPDATVAIGSSSSKAGQKCNRFNAETLGRLSQLDDVRLVVLAARWLPFLRSIEARRDRWLVGAEGQTPDRQLSAAIMQVARTMSTRGTPVLLIDQAASFSNPPPDCVIGARMAGRATTACNEHVSSPSEHAALRAMIDRAAAENAGVTAFHPADALCRGSLCTPVASGHLMYRDGNHLGIAGIRFYRPLLTAKVADALKPAP